jgi:hypothetical protein
MGKIHNLHQELSKIAATVTDYCQQLEKLYSDYLQTLGQSVARQLILATYQVCTQSYPREFLQLSTAQKQQIQTEIKKAAKISQEKIAYILEKSYYNILNIEEIPETGKIEKQITDPDLLLNWHESIEKEISHYLERLSMKVNHVLQQAKILPYRLPSQIIEMAIQAEEVGQGTSGTPNILNVLVEAERQRAEKEEEEEENEEEEPEMLFLEKVTRLTAIRLRLIEIEFADSTLSQQRQQLRQLLEKINEVRKYYHRKQKECAIAEAESAWRACWSDD